MAWVGHWQIYGNNDLRHFGLQLVMSSNWTTLSRGLSFNGPIWSVSLELVAYGLFLIALPLLRHFGLIAAVALAAVMWWLWTLPLYLFMTVWLADLTYRKFEIPASRALRKKLLL